MSYLSAADRDAEVPLRIDIGRLFQASTPEVLPAAVEARTDAVAEQLAVAADAAVPIDFERDILPIFTRYCFNCHGKSSPQLSLDLRTARSTMRGSQNGPVIVKGSLEKSLLWKKVSTREMPLALFKLRLSDAEIETVRRWIETGAPSSEPAELPADVQEQFTRFEKEIQPILTARCVECHGEDDPEAAMKEIEAERDDYRSIAERRVRLGLLLGLSGSMFFGLNAYMGNLLEQQGRIGLLSEALFWYNIAQVFASLVMLKMAKYWLIPVPVATGFHFIRTPTPVITCPDWAAKTKPILLRL